MKCPVCTDKTAFINAWAHDVINGTKTADVNNMCIRHMDWMIRKTNKLAKSISR